MGQIKKIGDEYYIEFYARGLLYQQKAGTDKEEAGALLRSVEEKIQQGEMGIIVRDAEVDVFFQTYYDFARRDLTEKSFARVYRCGTHFEAFLKRAVGHSARVSAITPSVIEHYRHELLGARHRGKPLTACLVNFTLLLIRDVMEYAIKVGYLNDNPTGHMQLVGMKEKAAFPRITDAELERVASCFPERYQNVLPVIARTGLRLSEVCRLIWAQVHLSERKLEVPYARNKARKVFLDDCALGVFERLRKGKKANQIYVFVQPSGDLLTEGLLEKWLKQAAQTAGCSQRINYMILRARFARLALEKGMPLLSLHKLMGYDDLARVMWYFPSYYSLQKSF